MLGELQTKTGRVVVADLEAGVGTVSRLQPGNVDRLVLVVEPSAKSMEVGRRAWKIAQEVGIQDVTVVVNKVVEAEDVAFVSSALPATRILAIPDDPAVLEADRAGLAPIDHAPDCPAVAAIGGVAAALANGG